MPAPERFYLYNLEVDYLKWQTILDLYRKRTKRKNNARAKYDHYVQDQKSNHFSSCRFA